MPEPLPLDPALPAAPQPPLSAQADTPPAPPATPPQSGSTPAADAPQTKADAAESNNGTGRDARGRFAKGNLGGPGNPFARQSAAFRKALCDSVTDDDIQALTRTLLEKARAGDIAAIKLLFAYTIGRPADAVNPDTLDVDELQCFHRQALPPDMPMPPPVGVPTALACQVLRGLMPAREDAMRQALADRLRQDLDKKERQQAAAATNPPQPRKGPQPDRRSKAQRNAEKKRRRKKHRKRHRQQTGQTARPPRPAAATQPHANGKKGPPPPMTNGVDRLVGRLQAEIDGVSQRPRRRC
jgi:hypothetical protein